MNVSRDKLYVDDAIANCEREIMTHYLLITLAMHR